MEYRVDPTLLEMFDQLRPAGFGITNKVKHMPIVC